MNIKEAKQEIIQTVQAYLQKDETGAYRIPVEKQRPIFMVGAPGIGKTAVMEQIAGELGIHLVSYTITHHTRQSAIGLPFISEKTFGGEAYSVTEYTMSEIIAAMYDAIEGSEVKEGILFLDEINCVSETLAPTMLQFLQYKTFGQHRIPEGFVIVTAGNPVSYNRAAREFDIATLDRLRRIEVSFDFPVWKAYAYENGIHGAILGYLEIKKEHFYRVQQEIEGKRFVTARGWEDLSKIIQVYEGLGFSITEGLASEYLEDPEIARDFTLYYELYQKYREIYRIPDILEGTGSPDRTALLSAPFDEKLSLLSLLIDALNQEFRQYEEALSVQRTVFEALKEVQEGLSGTQGETDPPVSEKEAEAVPRMLRSAIQSRELALSRKKQEKLLSRREERRQGLTLLRLQAMEDALLRERAAGTELSFSLLKEWFSREEAKRQAQIEETGNHLTNALAFLDTTFGEGQEMVIFLSELSAGYYSLRFVQEVGNDSFYRYNQYLLLDDRQAKLRQEIAASLSLS